MDKHDIRNDSLLTNVYVTVASLSGELCSICFKTAVVGSVGHVSDHIQIW